MAKVDERGNPITEKNPYLSRELEMLLVIQEALGLMIIYVQLPSTYKYILNIII